MAKRKKRKTATSSDFPAWAWMMFGLAIGLSVAFAIYINDRTVPAPIDPVANEPASMREQTPPAAPAASAYDDNGEQPAADSEAEEERFSFYHMLKNSEVDIVEEEARPSDAEKPQAVVEPGIYILQAGSFTQRADADRRRAELAMQNIESQIQRVSIGNSTYHRVNIGPVQDLDELNVLRARLQQAKIDVLRIRIGD